MSLNKHLLLHCFFVYYYYYNMEAMRQEMTQCLSQILLTSRVNFNETVQDFWVINQRNQFWLPAGRCCAVTRFSGLWWILGGGRSKAGQLTRVYCSRRSFEVSGFCAFKGFSQFGRRQRRWAPAAGQRRRTEWHPSRFKAMGGRLTWTHRWVQGFHQGIFFDSCVMELLRHYVAKSDAC